MSHTPQCILKPDVEVMEIRAQSEAKTTRRKWSSCYVQVQQGGWQEFFPPNLWVIFVGNLSQENGSHCALCNPLCCVCRGWRRERERGRHKKNSGTKMNKFHLNWQASVPDVFPKTLSQGGEVMTLRQLQHEVSGHSSSRVIIRWPCLLDACHPTLHLISCPWH